MKSRLVFGYFSTLKLQNWFLKSSLLRDVYKTTKNKINTGKDIHENKYAPDPSIHWKKETNDAANHITTQEVVD